MFMVADEEKRKPSSERRIMLSRGLEHTMLHTRKSELVDDLCSYIKSNPDNTVGFYKVTKRSTI